MPCYFPLQAISVPRYGDTVKRSIKFSHERSLLFKSGSKLPANSNALQIPCGKCMGCRLERSRQWAARCMHEAKMYEDNCFITLTYSDDFLPSDGSLVRKHVQDFMKRLRQEFSGRTIRFFGCGEYGEGLNRPHYHLCLFNLHFEDRVKFKRINDFWFYTSDVLTSLWKFGHCLISDFSFETAAYVARYCTKKINGDLAKSHYGIRVPEFVMFSNRPGIGKPWFDKFGQTDVFPSDTISVRGAHCKPPRYYDLLRERVDPDGLAKAKEARRIRGESKQDDNSFERLGVKLKCQERRMKLLIRNLER